MDSFINIHEKLIKNENVMQQIINESQQKLETSLKTEKHMKKIKGRDPFTPDEDEKLKKLVEKYGTKQWKIIAPLLPGRSPKQCRDRYTNYLMPGFFKGEWSNNEDMMLMKLFSIHGPKWSILKRFFPNRSSNSIKNRWTYFLCKQCNIKEQCVNNIGNLNIQKCNEMQLNSDVFNSSKEDNISNHFNVNISIEDKNSDVISNPFEKAMTLMPSENDVFQCFENIFDWNF